MNKENIFISKDEARAILATLDWCECDFKLGKHQENVRKKLINLYSELPMVYKHKEEGISM